LLGRWRVSRPPQDRETVNTDNLWLSTSSIG
jgi:hypothetical protein